MRSLHDRNIADNEKLLDDVYYLHRSTFAKFNRLATQYSTIELSFKSTLDKQKLSEIARISLMCISKTLNNINLSQVSSIHKWFAQVLENNINYLDNLISDTSTDTYFPRYVYIEKIACGIASLFLLPSILHSLRELEDLVEASTIENSNVIENHMFDLDDYNIISSAIPSPNLDLGFYEPSMNNYILYSVDIAKNAAKIQSTANMHTIAVLLTIQ